MQEKKPFRATLLAMAAVTTLTTTVGTANAAPGLVGSSDFGSSDLGSSLPGSSDLGSSLPGSSDSAPGETGLYEGSVEDAEEGAEGQSLTTGHVFDDGNKNWSYADNEKGIERVKVTNGRDVTAT